MIKKVSKRFQKGFLPPSFCLAAFSSFLIRASCWRSDIGVWCTTGRTGDDPVPEAVASASLQSLEAIQTCKIMFLYQFFSLLAVHFFLFVAPALAARRSLVINLVCDSYSFFLKKSHNIPKLL